MENSKEFKKGRIKQKVLKFVFHLKDIATRLSTVEIFVLNKINIKAKARFLENDSKCLFCKS